MIEDFFVKTPRKFIIAKLFNCKLETSSILIMRLKFARSSYIIQRVSKTAHAILGSDRNLQSNMAN